MPNFPETELELKELWVKTLKARDEAKAVGDQAAQVAAEKLLDEIFAAQDDLAYAQLAGLAAKLSKLQATIEAAKKNALAWPFGLSDAPDNHERAFGEILPDNDFEDQGPSDPPPQPPAAPIPEITIPTVSPKWANEYAQLWHTMVIRPEWAKTADAIARKIIGSQGRYAAAVSGTSIPWWFVAVVHSMECSLKFTEHLHNGDPLSAQTVRVPKGRPPFRAPPPPFKWEESARDAILYEKLDKVTDWSLQSVLYHWHRFNGINNEYKKRGIPTPYLWSGSQHYRKGKYIADNQFDPEKVSGQVGAAVLLKTLIDIGALGIDNAFTIEANAAAATGHVDSLTLITTGGAFKHVSAELDYPGQLKIGSGKKKAEQLAVRRVQEWLNLHDLVTPIDSDFGESTAKRLKEFQLRTGREATGELDEETWALLTARIRRAVTTIAHAAPPSLERAAIEVARQHINQRPTEVGGNNRGPWVRLYMAGKEGAAERWCAGFVCFVVAQAARDLNINIPFKREEGVDDLVKNAKKSGRFVSENEMANAIARKSKLRVGNIFVVRASATDWTHTGFVLAVNDKTFDTLEGNTGGEGGVDGPNAREGNRSYDDKDFLRLI